MTPDAVGPPPSRHPGPNTPKQATGHGVVPSPGSPSTAPTGSPSGTDSGRPPPERHARGTGDRLRLHTVSGHTSETEYRQMVGRRVRTIRVVLDVSQDELAEAAGTTRNFIRVNCP